MLTSAVVTIIIIRLLLWGLLTLVSFLLVLVLASGKSKVKYHTFTRDISTIIFVVVIITTVIIMARYNLS